MDLIWHGIRQCVVHYQHVIVMSLVDSGVMGAVVGLFCCKGTTIFQATLLYATVLDVAGSALRVKARMLMAMEKEIRWLGC